MKRKVLNITDLAVIMGDLNVFTVPELSAAIWSELGLKFTDKHLREKMSLLASKVDTVTNGPVINKYKRPRPVNGIGVYYSCSKEQAQSIINKNKAVKKVKPVKKAKKGFICWGTIFKGAPGETVKINNERFERCMAKGEVREEL